jgi:hypothetical protein
MNTMLSFRSTVVPRAQRASLFFVACFVAGWLLPASPAAAQGLTPGASLDNPAALFQLSPNKYDPGALTTDTTYTQLVAGPTPFAALGSYLGATVFSSVYKDPTTGYLAFDYQIVNNSISGDDVQIMTINGTPGNPTAPIWQPFTIFRAGAPGSGSSHSPGAPPTPPPTPTWTDGNPYTFEQLNDGSYGIQIDFAILSYGTQLLSPGDYSANMWLTTNAQNYQVVDVGLSDSAPVGSANAYGPASGMLPIVPEPSTIVTSLIGFGILAAAWRRRRSGADIRPASAC